MASGSEHVGTLDLIKRMLVGRALAGHKLEHQLLPKTLALPVFSSDPLSSNAYATQEMMLVLTAAGTAALVYMVPIGMAIAALLLIVVTSYRQTVRAYPHGGGSYIVAKENLGQIPGLVAAAAILTDYVLTVAVSITAGTVAITTVAPELLDPLQVPLALALIALMMMANLRGVREAGLLFAVPTYGFVLMVGVTLAAGLVECVDGCPVASTATLDVEPVATLSLFLVLRAFSSGSTALTGVEAIADGVQAFRRPAARNAATTLAVMGALSVTMFLGITILARALHVHIDDAIADTDPVLAQIGATVFGRGLLFVVLQAFTAGILVLAANTAFQDFPRLSSILARDRFMPSQLRNRGDRLVFSNGVVVLSVIAGMLVWIFEANLTHLIQLYVIGVFTAFTLSQAGMVRRWVSRKEGGWRRSAIINGVGAFVTGVVLVIVTMTKFAKGAWIVIVAVPIIVCIFSLVHRHYERIARLLEVRRFRPTGPPHTDTLFLVSDLGAATLSAVGYLRAVRPRAVIPVWVGNPQELPGAAATWSEKAPRLGELIPLGGGTRGLSHGVRALARARHRDGASFVAVVVPEAIRSRGILRYLIARRRLLLLKLALLSEPGVIVTDVPLAPGNEAAPRDRPVEPERNVVLVLVSRVHDGTLRAIDYATSIGATSVQALFLVGEGTESAALGHDWIESGIEIPLIMVEAPFRDLVPPLLAEIRKHTSRPNTVVTVVLPELVPAHWWQEVLHSQTAVSLKSALLFEPNVVLTSVPLHLNDRDLMVESTRNIGPR
jgi:amino acid transporter